MKKPIVITLSILLILLTASGIVVSRMINMMNVTVLAGEDGKPLTREQIGIGPEAPKRRDTGVMNVLLLGVDRRTGESARTDTMMIASIDTNDKNIKLTSIMRDLFVAIPDRNPNRINTAFAFGGPALAIKTVNTLFHLDIEHYVAVDFFSFQTIVDQVGGVPIEVKRAEVQAINKEINWQNTLSNSAPSPLLPGAGLHTLNGSQALAYSRIRSVGNNDFERTERQRRVLNELFKKGKSVSVTNIPGLANAVLPYIETNISGTDAVEMAIAVLGFNIDEVEQFRIPADRTFQNEYINNMLVLNADIDTNRKMLHEFIYGTVDTEQ